MGASTTMTNEEWSLTPLGVLVVIGILFALIIILAFAVFNFVFGAYAEGNIINGERCIAVAHNSNECSGSKQERKDRTVL